MAEKVAVVVVLRFPQEVLSYSGLIQFLEPSPSLASLDAHLKCASPHPWRSATEAHGLFEPNYIAHENQRSGVSVFGEGPSTDVRCENV